MSDSVSTAAAKPVRLVAGRYRTWLARWRIFVAWAFVAWPAFAAWIIVARLPAPGSYLVAAGYVWLFVELWWIGCVRRAYWRARWRWDARAGGLCKFAEKGVNITYNRLEENTLELAPALLRVRVDGHGNRRYTVRPLPGSSADEYGIAVELLRTRWRATSVQILPDDSRSRWARGRVVIQVVVGRVIERPMTMPVDLLT